MLEVLYIKHMKYLSSSEVAKIMGCNESTIRRWADKGKITCKKTVGGNRFFTVKDVRDCMKNNKSSQKSLSLNIKGNSLKKILGFINDDNFDKLKNIMVDEGIKSNDAVVSEIINTLYMRGDKVHDIFDNLIMPSILVVENLLNEEKITHIEESVMRLLLTRNVENLCTNMPNGSFNGKNALCINFEDNLPDIGVVMSEAIFRHNGFNVFNTGSLSDLGDIKTTIEKYNIDSMLFYLCNMQCCNSVLSKNLSKTSARVIELCSFANSHNLKVYFGGEGLELLNVDKSLITNTFLSFNDLRNQII